MKHAQTEEVDPGVFFGPDPDLALARADMSAWDKAHPCKCEALCQCEERKDG